MSIKSLLPLKPPIQPDLAQTLGQKGIHLILELIRDAYFDLANLGFVNVRSSENEITEKWHGCVFERIEKLRNLPIKLTPIPQKEDTTLAKPRGKPPTIDYAFCLRNKWDNQIYFGVECKLIESNNKTLCDEYGKEGVERFLECRYSSKCSQGAMLGYVRETQCSDVAEKIKERLTKLPDSPSLNQTRQLIPFKEHYISVHKRDKCLSPFTLHHFFLFFDVSNIAGLL